MVCCKGYRSGVLYDGFSQSIHTDIGLYCDWCFPVVIFESGLEKDGTDVGFDELECWIHRGVPAPGSQLFMEKGCFAGKAWYKRFNVIY